MFPDRRDKRKAVDAMHDTTLYVWLVPHCCLMLWLMLPRFMACQTLPSSQNTPPSLILRSISNKIYHVLKSIMSQTGHRSASSVQPDTIEELCDALQRGDKVDLTAEFWTRNNGKLNRTHNDRTALSLATRKQKYHVVRLLLERGANVNAGDARDAKVGGGRTALSYAAQLLDTNMIKLLKRHGAEVDIQDATDRTPVSWVASTNWAPDSSLFQSPFARPSTSPVHECLDLLKEYSADFQKPDETDRTPLSWAAEEGLVEMVEYFHKHWPTGEVFKRDEKHRSPLSFAAEKQHYGVIAILAKWKHSYKDRDHLNQTPLHWLYRDYHNQGGYKEEPRRTEAMDSILTYLGFKQPTVMFVGHQTQHNGSADILSESVVGGKTLLAYAVWNNDEELIHALWTRKTGINPDVPNNDDKKTARVLVLEQATLGQSKFIKHPLFQKNLKKALPAVIKDARPAILKCLLCQFAKDSQDRTRVAKEALWRILDDASENIALPLLRTLFEVLDTGAVDITKDLMCQKKRLESALVKKSKPRDLVQVLLEYGLDPRLWTKPEDWFERWADGTEFGVMLSEKETKTQRRSFVVDYLAAEPAELSVSDDTKAMFM
jgi:ankyrin repeat protein